VAQPGVRKLLRFLERIEVRRERCRVSVGPRQRLTSHFLALKEKGAGDPLVADTQRRLAAH
jgi:hypothetical protein